MMQLDQHVKAVFDAIVARTPDVGPAPSPDLVDLDRVTFARNRRWPAVAAAAILVIGAVGLIAYTGRSAPRAPIDEPVAATPEPSSPRPLATAGDLASSDWVIATALPEGLEFLYARRDGAVRGPDQPTRVIAYGVPRGDGTDEELWVEIDGPGGGTPDESWTVGDVVWAIDGPDGDWWSASASIGDTDLQVRGSGEFEQVLAGLAVVDESALPFTPLGNPDDAVAVAETSLDGDTYTYSVQESGRYKCDWVTSPSGTGGGCGSIVQHDAVVTIDGGVMIETETRTGTVDAVRSGSVSAAVASVEVVFADGTIVTVRPADLSGTSDRRFWIAAARISTTSPAGAAVIDESVAEVRAYDRAGTLIGTAVPPWLHEQGDEAATDAQEPGAALRERSGE